ncbi:phospholipase A and acyltransferase 2-like isoform 2-T2 [Macrochelys suwanniensis]
MDWIRDLWDLLSSAIMLEPGDLIEFQRMGYQHWGIYVGKGHVVHFTFPELEEGLNNILNGEFVKAKVQKERLRNVAHVSNYAVNNQLDKKHPPLPLPHVVKRAEHLVGKNIDYNLVMSNCEHFATMMRYGIAESQQAVYFAVDEGFVKQIKKWLAEINE